jgi:putative ABC transport system permease protein
MTTIQTLLQDLRYAARSLRQSPGFTAAALVTLGLGIGATSAIFSVVHAVLLRPLPYPEPDRIVQLVRRTSGGIGDGHTGRRYLFYREHANVAAMAAWRGPSGINLATGDAAEFVRAMPVSKEFFDVLGIRPALGAPFTAEHDRVGGPLAVILSHGTWTRNFGSDPAIIGKNVLLGERLHVVVGVMPASFAFLQPADAYIPLRPSLTGPGGGYNYGVMARLRPGVTVEQANAETAAIWQGMRQEFPQEVGRQELPTGFEPLQKNLSRGVRSALLMMMGAVGLLLVIACANTANLLLARASGRGREIAVRAALGATRARIIAQLLTESVLLSVGGAVAGAALAYLAVPLLLAVTPPNFRLYQEVGIDRTVFVVTMAIAVFTGLLFGLAPALSVSRANLVESFKDDGTRSIGTARAAWLRRAIVVSEVALCVLLLVGAGLLIKTFSRMSAIDPGFDPRRLVTARMALQGERYSTRDTYTRFFDEGLERLRRIPGVESAAIVNGVPIERGLNLNVDILDVLGADGRMRFEDAVTDWRYASTGYFSTMGIPIVRGRGFEERDRAGAAPVAVVNQEFARRFYGDASALGRRIRVYDDDGSIEIVGIAKDVREQGLTARLPPVMYVPASQANPAGVRTSHTYFQMSWVVKTRENAGPIDREVREALRSLDPAQPLSAFRTMEQVKGAAVDAERFQMTLMSVFAAVGLLLATAGVYGVVSYSAAQRTREFGIRMALGATRGRILGSVLRSGATLALTGVLVGVAGSLASARVLQGFVWGVSTTDPATYMSVAALLIGVALVASLLPALHAVRQDPVRALRDQ